MSSICGVFPVAELDRLTDDEFEELVEHSLNCTFHATILDAIDENTIAVYRSVTPGLQNKDAGQKGLDEPVPIGPMILIRALYTYLVVRFVILVHPTVRSIQDVGFRKTFRPVQIAGGLMGLFLVGVIIIFGGKVLANAGEQISAYLLGNPNDISSEQVGITDSDMLGNDEAKLPMLLPIPAEGGSVPQATPYRTPRNEKLNNMKLNVLEDNGSRVEISICENDMKPENVVLPVEGVRDNTVYIRRASDSFSDRYGVVDIRAPQFAKSKRSILCLAELVRDDSKNLTVSLEEGSCSIALLSGETYQISIVVEGYRTFKKMLEVKSADRVTMSVDLRKD